MYVTISNAVTLHLDEPPAAFPRARAATRASHTTFLTLDLLGCTPELKAAERSVDRDLLTRPPEWLFTGYLGLDMEVGSLLLSARLGCTDGLEVPSADVPSRREAPRDRLDAEDALLTVLSLICPVAPVVLARGAALWAVDTERRFLSLTRSAALLNTDV